MKRRIVKWDEWDLVTGWRYLVCRYQRAGVTSGIKRRVRRRERRDARGQIEKERYE